MVEDNIKADKASTGKTSVFLAWSGLVSQKMAGLLKDYLPLFVRNIDIFMSEDITKGKRWHTEIAKALGSTKFGILCLTPENLTSEWIHFEAGALSKTIDDSTHVCPLLLDVKKSELKEPLASFHATIFDKEEFKKLIKALAQACGDSLEDGQFTTLMEALWPRIDSGVKELKVELAEIHRKSGKSEEAKPKVDSLIEEVVVRIREQGRLLAILAEQREMGLGKEVNENTQKLMMMLQEYRHEMKYLVMRQMEDRRRFFKDREERNFEKEELHLTDRMRELADILQNSGMSSKSNPETVLDALIRTGQFSERMLEVFGGRTGTIEAIKFLLGNFPPEGQKKIN